MTLIGPVPQLDGSRAVREEPLQTPRWFLLSHLHPLPRRTETLPVEPWRLADGIRLQ